MHLPWILEVCCTQHELPLRVTLDQQVQNIVITQSLHKICGTLDDQPGTEHCLTIELHGKTHRHTQLDSQGNITQDRLIQVSRFGIDGLDFTRLLHTDALYQHDCNGTAPPVQEQFFGTMGCNGLVTVRFCSPVYLTLLKLSQG